jgi:hypothetical protein
MSEVSSETELEQPAIRRGATGGFIRNRAGATRHQAGCDRRQVNRTAYAAGIRARSGSSGHDGRTRYLPRGM